MECPICKCKTRIEVDTHSDGFAEYLLECGNCGTIWTPKGSGPVLINFSIEEARDLPGQR